MIRVEYETRCLEDNRAKALRCVEIVPAHELDIQAGKVRGVPVKIVQHSHCSQYKEKAVPAVRSSKREDFSELRKCFQRHYRRSKWKVLVLMLVDDFIKDLVWEEVLKERGFQPKPFSYHWERFKKKYHESLRWSPNTRNMMPRLESMPWLRVYLDEVN
ncbi:TPA: hypothetical protein NV740_000029 [Escherichia coli]|nr:hypothetical protein [Escherichia coli]HCJ8494772.1 hypothetical protein [Escherichia coli]HCJ8870042.1 hypothetical protein [Escherichia coli]HCJ9102183.1 hypothetical protein [Escherichia coli]